MAARLLRLNLGGRGRRRRRRRRRLGGRLLGLPELRVGRRRVRAGRQGRVRLLAGRAARSRAETCGPPPTATGASSWPITGDRSGGGAVIGSDERTGIGGRALRSLSV